MLLQNRKKITFPIFLGLATIVILLFSIFGDKGYIEYNLLKQKKKKLAIEIKELEKEKLLWEQKVYSLKTDKSYYENIIRERLGYVKKNEFMIELVTQEK